MRKYYLDAGGEHQGPYDVQELLAKNITAETLLWPEGQPEPVKAGEVEELKALLTPVPPPLPTEDPLPTVSETIPVAATEPVVTAAAAKPVTPAPKVEKPKPVSSGKKSTAWVSWVLTLLVLGGAGYFVYQDMEKNKGSVAGISRDEPQADTATSTTTTTTPVSTDPASPDTIAVTTTDVTTTTEPVATNTTATTTTTNNKNQTAAQIAAAKKAEAEKNKKLTTEAQKKAEAEKAKQEAAKAAALAKEMDMRNRWPSYIRLGSINPNYKGEGVEAFDIPVYNGTDGMLDKVTIRIEYLKKKEKKIYKTENITINNIPARTTINGRAPESKKGEKVNVIITGITSKKLHFCYPVNNGNAEDPYYCN